MLPRLATQYEVYYIGVSHKRLSYLPPWTEVREKAKAVTDNEYNSFNIPL
jgi:hypothetical protein